MDVGILTGDIVYLYATTDSDQLIGSAGNDLFAGSAGDDTVSGFNGNDLIFGDDDRAGGTGSDILDGGAGNDIIYGGGGADKITGGSGRDIAAYFSEPDSNGNAANIYISLQDQSRNTGEAAGDTFSGIEGLRAGVGSDILIGDSQNNTLQGDFLEFHAGADNLFEHGNDFLDGAAGIDTAIYGQGNGATAVSLAISGPQNTGAWGVDTLISIENLTGSDGVDNFTGNNGVNVLDGGGGNDKLVGLGGTDRLLGGAGNDVLIGGSGVDSMAGGSGDDVYYLDDLAERPVELVNSGIDTIVASFDVNLIAMANVEKAVLGGTGGFSATGNALANALSGNTGNNVLSGGLGIDTLRGGAGNDSFQFDTGLNAITNVDKILDFSAPNDTLRLENTGAGLFNTLSLGTLSIDAFQANATGISADATDRIIYNTKTGELFYDLNGNLAGGAIKFAVLTTHPVITHLDFFVV